LEIGRGEIVGLVGESGSGKTTVAHCVLRLLEPDGGQVSLDGTDITHLSRRKLLPLRPKMHMVFQDPYSSLNPRMTVGDIVAAPLRAQRTAGRADKVTEMLTRVGLSPQLRSRYPHELSGGQRQRVGVARALAADPVVLLMDEPFSAVDPIVRARLQDEFLRLQRTVGKTIVFVTHDVDEAVRLGDRIAVLSEGGKLEQYATPAELLAHPANDFVADFVGADRGIKRLAVTPIPLNRLRPVDSANHPVVEANGTLKDALAALLEGRTGAVAVDDKGMLTLEDVYTALREAAA
jgi:osmoprotectant transport system ATP-binding protein